ncbi:MAG TPA: NAD(P)-dependent oxidoreductase [Acidimicrobiales bacterium]|nr:NAD(P)-dependent oxidoreductase [Acidimicrobiales bacterium]
MTASPTVVVNRGAHGDLLAQALRSAAPSETFVVCGAGDVVPDAAQVLVTLLEDPDSVKSLLAPSIEWVHVLGTGVDGFPFQSLGGRTLTCSRGAASVAISEWVLAVMLAFEKQIPGSWISEPPARWNVASLGGLSGQTLGLVGIGAIGAAVARRAVAFDMTVLANRRRTAPSPVPEAELVKDLDELMSRSDHLVVAAPSTPASYHLIGKQALAAAKPGLHLINVARGTLIDQEELRLALDDGRVARASLDTVDPEPLPPGHWLYNHEKVKLSAHISWSGPRTMSRTLEIFIDDLARFRRGERLEGVVDPEAGY